MKEFVIQKDRSTLRYTGDISQFAGAKRYEFIDGKAKGIEAADIRTGTGFEYTVLPGRGMDIAHCSFKGVPVAYMSKTGINAPGYFESYGSGFLRNFFGGLLTTCGLSNVGIPCSDEHPVLGTEYFGLHGRISNAGAYQVCVQEDWNEHGEYVISVSGKVREAQLHGECFVLHRQVKSIMGSNSLTITDNIENQACYEIPFMILYHINIGYPILDEGSRLILNSRGMTPKDAYSECYAKEFDRFKAPVKREREHVFFHDINADVNGETMVALVNDQLEAGVYLKWNKNELPMLTQWKMGGESEYVCGIEPANCLPTSRTEQKERMALQYLKPFERKSITLEFGILNNAGEITEFESKLKSLGQEKGK